MTKKKTNMRQVIRQIVREEVAMAIKEVITELKQPTQSQPTKPVKEKSFTKNKVINDVLNETANGDWKTMGGSKFTSERMNELVGGQYANLMNDDSDSPNKNLAVEMGVNPNDPANSFLTKDYRQILKKAEEKQKQKYGK